MARGPVKTSSKIKKVLRDNGLSIVLFLIIVVTVAGHVIFGHLTMNQELQEYGRQPISIGAYLFNGHFLSTFFENWESEFLQMVLYILLTVSLFQRGSSESKDPDSEDPVDKEPDPKKKDAPGPVKKGGLILKIYKYSLTIAFFILFFISFLLHAYGGAKEYNQEQELKGSPERTDMISFMAEPEFWFQSFQNWQSEFIAIFAIVVLSIFLRQKGSPESKPVDAPHSQTSE